MEYLDAWFSDWWKEGGYFLLPVLRRATRDSRFGDRDGV